MSLNVRVGQAVDIVGQAGNPKKITDFQTQASPISIRKGKGQNWQTRNNPNPRLRLLKFCHSEEKSRLCRRRAAKKEDKYVMMVIRKIGFNWILFGTKR